MTPEFEIACKDLEGEIATKAVEAERKRISEEIHERMFHCEGDDCMPLTKEVETILDIINQKK